MANVFNLTQANFFMGGEKKKYLGLNTKGPFLVLFKSESCPGCLNFKPVYAQLSMKYPSVKFTVIDVAQYKSVVELAKTTLYPIQRVPTLFFYYDSKPRAKYNGGLTAVEVDSFISGVLGSIQPEYKNLEPQGYQSQPQHQMQPSQPRNQFMPTINVKGAAKEVHQDTENKLSTPSMAYSSYNRAWEGSIKTLLED
jgi:thiol-disulfide isomerase/thioredoxin